MPTTLSVDVQIDGTPYDAGSGPTPADHIREVWFGPFLGGSGPNHFDLRNIAVGTGGFGSADVWSPALSGLGDFDAFFGTGADPTFSGGVMSVDNVRDRYGVHDLGSNYTELWVQFDLFIHADDNDPDWHDVALAGGGASATQITGLFNGGHTEWDFDGVVGTFNGPPTTGVWITVGIHYRFLDAIVRTANFSERLSQTGF